MDSRWLPWTDVTSEVRRTTLSISPARRVIKKSRVRKMADDEWGSWGESCGLANNRDSIPRGLRRTSKEERESPSSRTRFPLNKRKSQGYGVIPRASASAIFMVINAALRRSNWTCTSRVYLSAARVSGRQSSSLPSARDVQDAGCLISTGGIGRSAGTASRTPATGWFRSERRACGSPPHPDRSRCRHFAGHRNRGKSSWTNCRQQLRLRL